MDAIVLAGGRGTRLAEAVDDLPKSLAPVNGRPFLDYLLVELASSGLIHTVVLALGYLADSVIEHYRNVAPPIPLRFALEAQPLGTAGALRNALPFTSSDVVVAYNGDTLVHVDLRSLLELRAKWQSPAALAIARADDRSRYASVRLKGEFVTGFAEKTSGGPGLVNAGVYALSRGLFDVFPSGPLSMELDVLPQLASRGQLVALEISGPLLDIGLPDTYVSAGEFVSHFFEPSAWHRANIASAPQ